MQAVARALVAAATFVSLTAMAPDQQPAPQHCPPQGGECTLRVTPRQLLAMAEKLVLARRFDEARPLIAALAAAPDMHMQRTFLEGYVAVETGDLETAEQRFRDVLRDHPKMTRARLELARTLMLRGKDKAADHHFRLAQQDRALPPDIARTIYAARGILSERRVWSANFDFGFAPDTNINNATADRTVDVIFGNTTLPLQLDDNARRRSGLGQTASLTTDLHLRLTDRLAFTVDANGQLLNYKGKAADDISVLLAAGPELTLRDGTRLGLAVTGSRRWYGGVRATDAVGGRLTMQKDVGASQRVGVQLDLRDQSSGYGEIYDGTASSAYATYERIVNRSMVASATLFARREDLKARAYSSTELGGSLGIGGELPFGLNAGLSAGLSRARFDAPIELLSPDPRLDWRLNARAYLGTRALVLGGFSPSVTYTYARSFSNIGLYQTSRHRVQFGVSRFF